MQTRLCVKGRPSGPMPQLAECLNSKREAFGSSSGRATIFPPLRYLVASVTSWLGPRASVKVHVSLVPPLFRAGLGTNHIKQQEDVEGRPSDSVTPLAECSHGKRETWFESRSSRNFSFLVTYALSRQIVFAGIIRTKNSKHLSLHIHSEQSLNYITVSLSEKRCFTYLLL